jgi:hypothetical protein
MRAEGLCDGAGTCVPGIVTACGAYACYNNTYCSSACITNADCATPYTCSGITCVSPGLLLRWAFDEESATSALDSSGNGRTGSGEGSGSNRPQPSSNVPALRFSNPRSRAFVAALDECVVYGAIPPALKASPEMTLATWFRTTSASTGGSDVINVGGDVNLRLKDDSIQFIRRRSTVAGMAFALAELLTTAHLDGRWHHLVGVGTAAGLTLYLDGQQVASRLNAEPILFVTTDQIGAGCQPSNDLHQFDGELDDVRIYGRALGAAEVENLARGNR